MAQTLPRLRLDLDFMPSPLAERPGLFVRDPYRYTEAAIIIPPLLVEALPFFDGDHSDLDLQAHLVRLTGELVPHDVVGGLAASLDEHGFLQTAGFEQLKQQKQQTFRDAPTRLPVHAGAAYPYEDQGLRERLESYQARYSDGQGDGHLPGRLLAIAAPHVSPEGGWRSYTAAYRCLGPAEAEKTVIVLGTSHYGPPEKFGLTRKPFVTPLGALEPDLEVINELVARGGDAVVLEDYCHSIEHSIEFQCVFLQHRLGSGIKLVPILCGPLAESLLTGRRPETNDTVRRFFDALREVGEKLGPRLLWVLGIDLAHIGRRYGDPTPAAAETGRMTAVRASDLERLEKVCASDREGFFELVHPGQDALRWCGYSPVYTFLQAVPAARGRLLHYEQWNIDEQSVVSFAGLEFRG